jgi:hypothetical protein
MQIKWVIQNNLINAEDHDRIRDVCIKQGYLFESIKVIPFSPDIPEIGNECPTIFYGATNFINNIYISKKWSPGAFFDIDKFTVRSYMEHYQKSMLNYPCEFFTLESFASSHKADSGQFFVRPVKDMKEFAGNVIEFNEVIKWARDISYAQAYFKNPNLNLSTEIAVSEPYNIAHEWRVFVVNGKVSSGSHYRSYLKLDPKAELPEKVIDFVQEQCKIWVPDDVFVMDIGESAGNLYIIECNCFNSSGFYMSNVEKIITDISSNFQEGPKNG